MNYNVGKYLIFTAFILAVLSPFLFFIVGLPVYLSGVYFVVKSSENDDIKALWIFLPIVLYLPVIMLLGNHIY